MTKKTNVREKKSPGQQGHESDTAADGMLRKIQARAYELYERRGRADGFAMEDWLQAEQEVLSEHRLAELALLPE